MKTDMSAAEFRRLPYRRRVVKAVEDGHVAYLAFIEEIPWIRVRGDQPDEAALLLDETFDDAIEVMIAAGDEIPRPMGTLEVYGRPKERLVRLPIIRAGARVQPLREIRFSEAREVEPWSDPTIESGRLTTIGS